MVAEGLQAFSPGPIVLVEQRALVSVGGGAGIRLSGGFALRTELKLGYGELPSRCRRPFRDMRSDR
jgi:hypothetical protein